MMSQNPCSSALLRTGPASTPNVSIEFHGLRPKTVTVTPRLGKPSTLLISWPIIAANCSAVLFSLAGVTGARPWFSCASDAVGASAGTPFVPSDPIVQAFRLALQPMPDHAARPIKAHAAPAWQSSQKRNHWKACEYQRHRTDPSTGTSDRK